MSINAFEAVTAKLAELRVVPVIVIDDPAGAVGLARALVAGGLPVAEVTFRTAGAAEAIRRMTTEVPDLLVGAGTVLTPAQADAARAAGAKFIVAPGFSRAMVEDCLEHGTPVYPGVATPTEIEAALALGLSTLKLFPAEQLGGVGYLKAISAPYGGVRFMPTGGITRETVGNYLALPQVVACGGSWLAPGAWLKAQQFDKIEAEAAATVAVVKPK